MGRELAGFRIDEHIGSGAAAAVYRGVNLLDDSIVRAIKVVHPALLVDDAFASRFAEEARILERLQHPNVVRFHGARWDGDYLLMELEMLQGQPLSDLVSGATSAPVGVEQALTWVSQASEGVAAAHALGIVHRDIKPSNLFLTLQQQVKVLDFGIARALDDADRASPVTRAGSVPGTPAYMAPEVCRWGNPSTTSDVYALGITLLELLTGHHPLLPPGKPRRSSAEVMLAQVAAAEPQGLAVLAALLGAVALLAHVQLAVAADLRGERRRFAVGRQRRAFDVDRPAARLRAGLTAGAGDPDAAPQQVHSQQQDRPLHEAQPRLSPNREGVASLPPDRY